MKTWDEYWKRDQKNTSSFYDTIAEFYRRYIIKPYLHTHLVNHFDNESLLLHAGCGSGQVETTTVHADSVVALDISQNALRLYQRCHEKTSIIIRGDLLLLPFDSESFDGIYNLGVMEHFQEPEIVMILSEFHRVLKKDGTVVLFWPPKYGLTVFVLKCVHIFFNRILKKDLSLHPAEPSLIASKKQVEKLCNKADFILTDFHFGWRDLFTYAIVVLQKKAENKSKTV